MTEHRKPLTAGKVLRRLVEIEEDGVEFYRGMEEGATVPEVRSVAAMMVRAELRHARRFLEYAERAESKEDPDECDLSAPLPREVTSSLMSPIFTKRERMAKSAPYASLVDVLRLAIRAEERTAYALELVKPYVPRATRPYIKRVIKEEWGHKARLEALLEKTQQ